VPSEHLLRFGQRGKTIYKTALPDLENPCRSRRLSGEQGLRKSIRSITVA
jgi:hypothetical protein